MLLKVMLYVMLPSNVPTTTAADELASGELVSVHCISVHYPNLPRECQLRLSYTTIMTLLFLTQVGTGARLVLLGNSRARRVGRCTKELLHVLHSQVSLLHFSHHVYTEMN